MDSKCRTAFRRRSRGLPLTVKAFRGKAPPTYVQKLTSGSMGLIPGHDLGNQSDNSLSDSSELQIHQGDVDLQQGLIQAQADGGLSGLGEIQVLHATPEQIAQLHQGHQIQILQGDNNTHIIQLSNSSSSAFSAGNIQNLSTSALSGSGAGAQNVQVTEIPISLPSAGPNGIPVPTGEAEDVNVKSDTDLNHEDLVHQVSQE